MNGMYSIYITSNANKQALSILFVILQQYLCFFFNFIAVVYLFLLICYLLGFVFICCLFCWISVIVSIECFCLYLFVEETKLNL